MQKLPFGLAIVGLFIAPLSYQFGFLPAFLWIILWHLASSFFLWHLASSFFLWNLRGIKNI